MPILYIAIGGALGALARYGVSKTINQLFPATIPLGTLLVNVLGSALIGALFIVIVEKAQIHSDWRNVLVVGFLGAFTTFSTFSLETVTMMEKGQWQLAFSYSAISLIACLTATAGAMYMTRLFFNS